MLRRTSAGRWRNEQSLFGDIGGPYWWSMQYGVVQRERTNERANETGRGKKRVDKLRERTKKLCLFGPIRKKELYWLVELEKTQKRRERIPLNFSFSLSRLNATRVPNGSKIPSSHLTIMLLEQKQQQRRRRLNREHCWERERKRAIDRQTEREKKSERYLSPISLVSPSSPTNDRKKLFPPNKSL